LVTASADELGLGIPAAVASRPLVFEEVYGAHFPFVFRSARRLGVEERAVDDVVQETFVIVHRRLAEFEARASVKTWIYAILRRVVRDHRRTLRRKSPEGRPGAAVDPESLAVSRSPQDEVADAEAVRVLYALLDTLDAEKRELIVLADLEQMTVPEIALALQQNVNTVYTRLRAARQQFEKAVARHRAREASDRGRSR
jgi:RNA polymerase sigma-70 factor (ECF subfamily)